MRKLSTLFILFIVFSNAFSINLDKWTIASVRIDYADTPINVSTTAPDISWILQSTGHSQVQKAYQILIASDKKSLNTGKADIWNSGKVASSASSHIYPEKSKIKNNTDYFIKITSWNSAGQEASITSTFSTTLLSGDDWKAHWIGLKKDDSIQLHNLSSKEKANIAVDSLVTNKSQYLRKEIEVKKTVKRARVFVTGLGFYELSINGQKVGNYVLTPSKTRYTDRVLFDVYDVKNKIKNGANAIGIHLGNSWYNTNPKYQDWRMPWFGYPRAIMELHIEYSNGSKEIIMTDSSWKTAYGPISANCIFDGEKYDTRNEQQGWNIAGFDDSKWKSAVLMEERNIRLEQQKIAPEQVIETIRPIKSYTTSNGSKVYDMGQNFSGWTKIKVKGEKGAKVILKHAEDIYADSTINSKSNRQAKNTDEYILNGDGVEEYEPRFTYHGFQYTNVQVEGKVEVIEVLGRVVTNNCSQNGVLQTDNELINKIHHCTLWSQRSNMHGLPLDCPQRDERLGWLADGYVTADEAMCNFDAANFYKKWMDDIYFMQDSLGRLPHIAPTLKITEATNWSAGYLFVIWDMYKNYGDKQLLARHYDKMKKYVNYLTKNSTNYILKADRYGDWGTPAQDNRATSGWVRGTPMLSTTEQYYRCATIAANTATVLGFDKEAEEYNKLKSSIKTAFNKTYYNDSTSTYKGEQFHFQFINSYPVLLGLTEETNKQKVLDQLLKDIRTKGYFDAGIIGLKYLVELLSAEGYNKEVWNLLQAKDYPGYSTMLKGRNTFPEWWNGKDSHNHIMFGLIDSWFYRSLAGIQTVSSFPGYEKIIIQPFFPKEGLNSIKASIQTVKGEVSSAWIKKGKLINLNIAIPANTTAKVILPVHAENTILNGLQIKNNIEALVISENLKEVSFTIGSGKWDIQIMLEN